MFRGFTLVSMQSIVAGKWCADSSGLGCLSFEGFPIGLLMQICEEKIDVDFFFVKLDDMSLKAGLPSLPYPYLSPF